MSEDAARPSESPRRQWRKMGLDSFFFQGLDQDAFEATHVDEVDRQGFLAGGVKAFGGIAFPQPNELLPLPELAPGHRTIEESVGEGGDRRSLCGSVALQPVRRSQSVGAELRGVVIWIGGTTAARLPGVDLDQLARW